MGDLETLLPDEIKTIFPLGNELVLAYSEASTAIVIATQHQIAILGFEAFEVMDDGLATVALADFSASISFAGDWKAYVAQTNSAAEQWIQSHRYGARYGYVLTSSSQREFPNV